MRDDGPRSRLTVLAARLGAAGSDAAVADAVGGLDAAVADAVAGLDAEPLDDTVLGRVVSTFGLSPFERDLLLLAGLPDEHEAFAEVARRLHPLGDPHLSFRGFAVALGLDSDARGHLRRAFTAGPLIGRRLLVSTTAGPLPECGWRVNDGLWNALHGDEGWPDGLCRTRPPHVVGVTGLPVTALVEAVASSPGVVVVAGSGRRPADELALDVRATLEAAGQRVVEVDAAAADGDRATLVTLHAVARGALPVVVGTPGRPALVDHPGPVVVCIDAADPLPLDHRPAVELRLPPRTLGEEVAMWETVAPDLNGEAARLAGLLRIDRVRAANAVGDARALARADARPLDATSIVHQSRRRTDSRLPSTVRRVVPTASRTRLVTTTDNDELLRSIVARVRGQVQVLHEWGFSAVGGGRGVRALFSGPPGTGKTLSAEITATELGLDLLTVDLSALVSKWLGETEKNIAEVFDAAEHSQAVLFFDEADAIFGRRTDAGDAQARWANLETAYLLSRIDSFDGLVVLATNLRANLDEAFVRRLDVIVEFDEPGVDERARLWRAHLPATAPLADDVDVDELAALYPIPGGVIRNAALAAGFDAAARGGPVDQRGLVDAVRREFQKSGRTFPGVPRTLTGATAGPTTRRQ